MIFTFKPPFDISGWTLEFNMAPSGGAIIITKAAVPINMVIGQFSFGLTHADTTQLPNAYVYEVWRTDTGNEVMLATGDLVIVEDAKY